MAHFVITYHLKPFMTEEEGAAMMEAVASIGPGPGEREHLVWVDLRGGTTIVETDDIEAVFRYGSALGAWMEVDVKIALPDLR